MPKSKHKHPRRQGMKKPQQQLHPIKKWYRIGAIVLIVALTVGVLALYAL